MSYIPRGSLVPLFPADSGARGNVQGKLTAWNAGTRANTVEVGGVARTNVPVLGTPTLSAPCSVLLVPFGSSEYLILDRIYTP